LIPDFDSHGNLPAGVHRAEIEDVEQRFGHGSHGREAGMQALHWLIPMCRRAGIVRLILNGSFVTDKHDPGDVDCLLVPGVGFDSNSDATIALQIGLPYLSIQIIETPEDLAYYLKFFGSDRDGRPKGLVEIPL
jgi:hypothetical protein